MRLDAAIRKTGVGLGSGFVKPQLDHRKIRMHRLQIIAQTQSRNRPLGFVQLLEAAPEMYEQQIALVPQ